MNDSAQWFQLGDIIRADFRTNRDADVANTSIMKKFGFQFRYQPARISIAMSLSVPTVPKATLESGGKPIKGDILFGSDEADHALWVALICRHSGIAPMGRRAFQELVAAHWSRGTELLQKRCEGIDSSPEALLTALSASI